MLVLEVNMEQPGVVSTGRHLTQRRLHAQFYLHSFTDQAVSFHTQFQAKL